MKALVVAHAGPDGLEEGQGPRQGRDHALTTGQPPGLCSS